MIAIKVYVISLVRSVDRRLQVAAMFAELGVDFEFFDAVDGRGLGLAAVTDSNAPWQLLPGEVGCYMSHLGVWRNVVDRNHDVALVLEDDVILDGNAFRVIDSCIKSMNNWDAVRLFSTEKQVGLVVKALDMGYKLVMPSKNPSGMGGYLISRSGALRMLAVYERISVPIDTAVDGYWRYGLSIPIISPPIVWHRQDYESTIGHEVVCRRDLRRGLVRRVCNSLAKKFLIYFIIKKYWGRSYGRWRFDV